MLRNIVHLKDFLLKYFLVAFFIRFNDKEFNTFIPFIQILNIEFTVNIMVTILFK